MNRRGDRFEFLATAQPDEEDGIDSGGLIGLNPAHRIVETRDRRCARTADHDEPMVHPARQRCFLFRCLLRAR